MIIDTNNNGRNDLIAYCKVIGMACDDCASYLNISLDRVWLYWKLIDVHIYQGINYSEDLKLNRMDKPLDAGNN